MTEPSTHDEALLSALARALTNNPRATLAQTAKDAGVSKATLYRFCKTREELVQRLLTHGANLFHRTMKESDLASGPPREALRRLVGTLMAHKEMAAFMNNFWKPSGEQSPEAKARWAEFEELSDAFFLRGQREGVFRVDIAASVMTEALGGIFCMLVDAEFRGRIAPAAMSHALEAMFFEGATAR